MPSGPSVAASAPQIVRSIWGPKRSIFKVNLDRLAWLHLRRAYKPQGHASVGVTKSSLHDLRRCTRIELPIPILIDLNFAPLTLYSNYAIMQGATVE